MQRNKPTDKQLGMILWRMRNSPIRDMLPARIEHKNGQHADYRFADAGQWLEDHLTMREASDLIVRLERDSFMETVEHLISIGFPIEHPNPTHYANPKS